MRIIKDQTAVLLIDIQERLFPAMSHKDKLLEKCRMLISGMNELNVPVLVTQQYSKGLGRTLPEISELLPDFQYIEKTSFSCCDEPMFVEKLEELKVKNVVICGIESHVCVLQTAIDLRAKGYHPVVVTDCISSRFEANQMVALERMKQESILLSSSESILFELLRSASSAEFKAISKLIK